MRMKPRFMFLAVLCVLATVAFAARITHKTETGYIEVVTTGDTAQGYKIIPNAQGDSSAVDSFVYLCTLVTSNDSANCCSTAITWTSPLQAMTITPGVKNSHAYGCTVIFVDPVPDESLYFAWTSPASNTTIDTVLDSLVHYFNNTTNLKDSVVATENGTSVTITAKFGQETFGERLSWSWGDSLKDTSSSITTAAMVCDSLTAKVNASAVPAACLTATDSTVSVFIQSDDPGLAFLIYIGDTATDTSHTQLNITSWSGRTDTIHNLGRLIFDDMEVAGIDFVAIIDSSDTVQQGLGLSDSGYLWLFTAKEVAGNIQYVLRKADTCASLPCTCVYRITADTTGGGVDQDSIFSEKLALGYRIADSASDTTMWATYRIYIDYILKGK